MSLGAITVLMISRHLHISNALYNSDLLFFTCYTHRVENMLRLVLVLGLERLQFHLFIAYLFQKMSIYVLFISLLILYPYLCFVRCCNWFIPICWKLSHCLLVYNLNSLKFKILNIITTIIQH